MKNLTTVLPAVIITTTFALSGCGNESSTTESGGHSEAAGHAHGPDGHVHEEAEETMGESARDPHTGEVELASMTVGGMSVELAQEHGTLEPGKELHLIIKLPYSDNGTTVIRAWLGTEDRFSSLVAKAEYASSRNEYDVHAVAPNPLPSNTMWWLEIEKPDGEKLIGSAAPR